MSNQVVEEGLVITAAIVITSVTVYSIPTVCLTLQTALHGMI